MSKIEELSKRYENLCNEYILEFCLKQELDFEGWVGSIVGGIAMCNDYFFDFSDIVYDINTNQPPDMIISWHNDNIESDKNINYYSYTKGLRIKDLNTREDKEIFVNAISNPPEANDKLKKAINKKL